MHSHLSPDLRKKHGARSLRVRVGDKVKVMRGGSKGQSGRVERISLRFQRVFVTKIESVKKDGTKRLLPLHPSNLMITDLHLEDKKRQQKVKTLSAKAEEKGK